MANNDAPKKKRTRKSSRKSTKKAKVEEALSDKVHTTVGRGVLAYFKSEAEPPPGGNSSPEAEDIDADLAAMLDEEVMAAGDVFEEVAAARKEAEREAPPPTEAETPAAAAPEPRPAPPAVSEPKVTPRPAETAPAPSVTEAAPREARPAETPPPAARETVPPAAAETEAPSPTALDVTPPRLRPAGTLMEHPMEVEPTPPGPGEGVPAEIPTPEGPPPTLSREEIVRRIADEHFKEVEEEINRLYDKIPKVLASNKRAADEALVALHEARSVLWTSPERLVDAEYQVNQVKTIIERHRLSEEWGRVYGRRLLIYESVWLLVLLGGFVGVQIGQSALMAWIRGFLSEGADTTYTSVIIPFLNSLVWGGIGGVVGALYSLWWHVSEMQDFDKRYNMWYLVQPIMGVVLGGIVYLIIATGFLALQGSVPTTESARGIQMFPSLVAVLGGFRQKFVYELLERIIRVLTPTPEG